MCGIFGIVRGSGGEVDHRALDAMADRLRHRGPDHTGLFQEPGIGLGSDRLAIVDTEGGNQPIHGADDTLVIVYNGEIYNHLEIRRELEARGCRFRTRSDTETVLKAFAAFGPDCVTRFDGMFAFAIWDRNARRLFLARDRLGIKPLYLCRLDDGIAFASEAKALVPLVPGGPRVDWAVIGRYFTLGYVPPEESPFAGIEKFPAGHHTWIECGDKAAPLLATCYWRPLFGGGEETSVATASTALERLLDDAVARELMSDVPLGVFLSGGLDSSAVAHYGAKRAVGRLRSFSLRFEEATHDESADARLVADHLGLDHHELVLTPELAKAGIARAADALDEPFGDSTALPLMLLSEFARKHVKVVLTGWGGDEAFAGYPTLKAHRAARLYRRLPAFLARRVVPAAVARLPVSDDYLSFEFKAKRFVRGVELAPEFQHFLWLGYFDDASKRRLFRPAILAQMSGDTWAPVRAAVDRLTETGLSDRIMHLDAAFFLPGNGLFQADRMTMAASLEARVPLLNAKLLDYALPLPASVKMPGGVPKGLLRRVLAPHLPRAIIDKPKKGFAPPSAAWMRGLFADLFKRTFAEDRVRAAGVFEYAEIRRLFDEHRSRKADHGRNLWALLSFQMWHERHIPDQSPTMS